MAAWHHKSLSWLKRKIISSTPDENCTPQFFKKEKPIPKCNSATYRTVFTIDLHI